MLKHDEFRVDYASKFQIMLFELFGLKLGSGVGVTFLHDLVNKFKFKSNFTLLDKLMDGMGTDAIPSLINFKL